MHHSACTQPQAVRSGVTPILVSIRDNTPIQMSQSNAESLLHLLQSDGMLGQEVQQPSKQAAGAAAGEAKSYSAGVLDWVLSTLYFTAGTPVVHDTHVNVYHDVCMS